jgi:hypothetical protein
MRTGPETAMRTRPWEPDQGGSVTLPRLVSMQVSHTIRPIARSENWTASRLSPTGHHPGASPSGPAEARCLPARFRALACLDTAARSRGGSSAAVRGPTAIVAIRV